MLEAGYGKIINTASMSAHIVNRPQNQAAYNSSKAGACPRELAAFSGCVPDGIMGGARVLYGVVLPLAEAPESHGTRETSISRRIAGPH